MLFWGMFLILRLYVSQSSALALGENVIRTSEVAVRAISAHQPGNVSLESRPVFPRPVSRDALGIMSSLRMTDLRLDLAMVD